MALHRYGRVAEAARAATGWSVAHCAPPGQFIGSNGIQFGPDGALYVAQMMGSQISALDVNGGAVRTVSAVNGSIHQPDDIAFDSRGTIYATEIMEGRIGALMPDGQSRVIAGDIPAANGVTVAGDRIFVDEFRPNGRMWEVFRDGSKPRLITDDLQWPNALQLGSDGYLYTPSVMNNEIWRVPVEGGRPERCMGDVPWPSAVKFDGSGRLHAVSSLTGEIFRCDLQTGTKTAIAKTRPGMDNLAFNRDGQLFVSYWIDGGISEIGADGDVREIVAPALLGPWGVAISNGALFAADGTSLARIEADGTSTFVSSYVTDPNFPGFLRNIAADEQGGFFTANSSGDIALFRPNESYTVIASSVGLAMGLAPLPGGRVAVADSAGGRLLEVGGSGITTLARDLGRPTGVALDADGSFYVADVLGGRLLHIRNGDARTVLDGLVTPHGVACSSGALYVVDRGAAALHRFDLALRRHAVIATNLPVGRSAGLEPHAMPGIPGLLNGPLPPFTGIAVGEDESVYVAADSDGSVVRVRPEP